MARTNKSNNYKRELKGLMPDEEDRKNIVNFISLYDKIRPYPHPESIGRCIEESLEEINNSPNIRKDGMTRRMSVPAAFKEGIEEAYPDLFSDKAKLNWFLENFPAFDLTK